MMFLDCPAYLGNDRAIRCGLPAEVRCRYIMCSTDGPIECAMIGCPVGHYFNAAIDSLTWEDKDNHNPAAAGVGSRGARDSAQRPNTAPAYFLGRPAAVYLRALRPRRRPAATRYPIGAAGSSGRVS